MASTNTKPPGLPILRPHFDDGGEPGKGTHNKCHDGRLDDVQAGFFRRLGRGSRSRGVDGVADAGTGGAPAVVGTCNERCRSLKPPTGSVPRLTRYLNVAAFEFEFGMFLFDQKVDQSLSSF